MLARDTWHRVEGLFVEALGRPEVDRAAFLEEACAGDEALRAEVASLLASHEEADAFLESIDASQAEALMAAAAVQQPRDGEPIGPWRIVRELGRGGMGVVYLAERADGQFEQTVALKLVKRGMDSDAILERFLNERQVMATLRHPWIARFYDGGATAEGTPWFAMEYVEGLPITDYCDTNSLSLNERLALFTKVCRAVEHAHNRLIIHRDLKPSNILVTENGNPRILDFGLARVLQDPSGDPATTRRDQRWLTLEYASPEQVKGEPVGTPSDTYQLGLVLYEMLTGRQPYTVTELSPTEAERVICEETPPKPSTAAVRRDSAGANGHSSLQRGRTPKRLKGDLDTILLKALQKDPGRRYASAEALANDIDRHLDGLPIHARPDTTGYRVRKFVQRHRVGVAAAAAIVLLLLASIVVLASQQAQTEQARERAEQQAGRAEEVIAYLTGLFEANDPAVAQGDTVTVREILERGVEHAEALDERPDLQATLFGMTAKIYQNLGNDGRAADLYRRALEGWGNVAPRPETEAERAKALLGLGTVLHSLERYDEAEPFLSRAADSRLSANLGDPTRRDALISWAAALHALGRNRQADSVFALWEATLDNEAFVVNPDIAMHMVTAGFALGIRGHLEHNLEMLRRGQRVVERALESLRGAYGRNHPRVAEATYVLGFLYYRELGQLPDDKHALTMADSLSREALTIHRDLFPEPNTMLQKRLNLRSYVLLELGRYDEAERLVREGLVVLDAVGDSSTKRATAMAVLARISLLRGNYDRASSRYREVRETLARTYGERYLETLRADMNVGVSLTGAGQFEEAEAQLLRSFRILEETRGHSDKFTRFALRHIVALYEAWNKPEQAARYRALLDASAADSGDNSVVSSGPSSLIPAP